MPQSQYRARQVSAKTHEVIDYDHDESKPGKPLHILIPGGLAALGALGTIILVIYFTWFEGRLTETLGLGLIALLAPFYIGGVFLFSYGYELYNIPRALRLTAIIVFLTFAAVVIVAVLILVLGAGGGKGIKGGSSRSRSSGGGGSKAQAKPIASSSASSGSSGGPNLGNLVVLGGGRTHTREVTREVVNEVEVPKEPMPVTCPYCRRSYVPIEHNYICPSCGAATPRDLIEESQMPKADDGR
jgi:hypothetical protein